MPNEYASSSLLVVDDDSLVVRAVCAHLKQSGYLNVVGLTDPKQVLDWMLEFHPDLVLLDIFMPEMSGLELLKQIRETRELDQSVVLMLSSAGEEERYESLELGAMGFIQKPATAQQLDTEIQRMLKVASRVRRMK